MKPSRPINLNLFTIHFPLPAIVSITHRITGVLLFILLPLILYAFEYSLNEHGFLRIREGITQPIVQFLIWLCLIPYLFHLVAGVRHLVMDLNIGVSMKVGRLTALLTFLISLLLIVLAGIWLW